MTELSEKLCAWLYAKTIRVPDLKRFNKAIRAASGYAPVGGWSLSSNALRALVGALHSRKTPRIIELGAGVSSIFLDTYYDGNAKVDSYEHQIVFAQKIKPYLKTGVVNLHEVEAWQFSDDEFSSIMRGEMEAGKIFLTGKPLEKSLYGETQVRNAFYRMENLAGEYDAMILDGPNGNGRSIAFAIMRGHMTQPAFILIDDCNHYEFICDCAQFFRFNILYAEVHPSKRWALLEAKER